MDATAEIGIFNALKDITALTLGVFLIIQAVRIILSNARERERNDIMRAQQAKDAAAEREREAQAQQQKQQRELEAREREAAREEKLTNLVITTMADRLEASMHVMGDTITRGMSDTMQLVVQSMAAHTEAIQRMQKNFVEFTGDILSEYRATANTVVDHDTHAMQRYDQMQKEGAETREAIKTNTTAAEKLSNRLEQINKDVNTLTIAFRSVADDRLSKEHKLKDQQTQILSLSDKLLSEVKAGFSEMREFFALYPPDPPPAKAAGKVKVVPKPDDDESDDEPETKRGAA